MLVSLSFLSRYAWLVTVSLLAAYHKGYLDLPKRPKTLEGTRNAETNKKKRFFFQQLSSRCNHHRHYRLFFLCVCVCFLCLFFSLCFKYLFKITYRHIIVSYLFWQKRFCRKMENGELDLFRNVDFHSS